MRFRLKNITFRSFWISTENLFQTRTPANSLFYVDQPLSTKSAGVCDLLMLIDKPAIQLALKERRTGKLLALEFFDVSEMKENGWKVIMEYVSSQSKILRNYEFGKVNACIISTEYTLVPESLFRPGDEMIYFKKNFSFSPLSVVRYQHISSNHLYSVFGVDKELQAELYHLFQDPQLLHHSQALMEGAPVLLRKESGKRMWLNVHRNKMDVVVMDNKKLLLMNSFQWAVSEDVLYFTLFICEQLEINPDTLNLIVTGEIETGSALYLLLYKYIRNIGLPNKPSLLSSFPPADLPFHHYSLLYNLSLCE